MGLWLTNLNFKAGFVDFCWVARTWWWLGLWVAMGGPTHGFVWSVEWRWVVLFQFVGGVGGQWSGGGLGFANLLVVDWVCWM